MEIEPEKFRLQYEVHKIFRVRAGVKTRVGRVYGNNNKIGLRQLTGSRSITHTFQYTCCSFVDTTLAQLASILKRYVKSVSVGNNKQKRLHANKQEQRGRFAASRTD